jgi:hypothetical protein
LLSSAGRSLSEILSKLTTYSALIFAGLPFQ